MKKIVVLTGAGVSAESGLSTFRDAGGLWEGRDIMEVASIEGFRKNPQLVLDFYNKRRKQALEAKPNPAHLALAELDAYFNVAIVTQNVDDLHERAGSQCVVHLHGELLKARSTVHPDLVYHWPKDIKVDDMCERGCPLRPDIVWFGELVPNMERGMNFVQKADILIVVGTSLQVYPAAGLIEFYSGAHPITYIDPNPSKYPGKRLEYLAQPASVGVPALVKQLINKVNRF